MDGLVPLTPAEVEILLALSWAGPFSTRQLQHLLGHVFASPQMVYKRSARLERAGLVAGRVIYAPKTARRGIPPRRVGKVCRVTDLGRQCVVGHDREPYRDTVPGDRVTLAEHDGMVSETLVHLISQTRPILSGVGAFREMRVDATRTRPIADTILWLRTRFQPVAEPVIHWSRLEQQPDEAGLRVVAIEVDRGTEDLGVIADKAKNYQEIAADADYLERYHGVVPMALWVAHRASRMQAIHARWMEVWPQGTWWRTHDDALRADQFWEYAQGKERMCSWLDDWTPAVQYARGVLAADAHERIEV